MSTKEAASVAAPPAAADGAEKKDEDEEDEEGHGGNAGLLAESVTKDEWKSIEASLTYNKKTVAEMLKRACGQVRHKGEILIDDSNGKFLGDMLPEMENFSNWCYKEHIRPKLLSLPLTLPEEDDDGKKKKGGGGGPKKGPPKKGGGGGGKEEKIPAKQQIKIDNVMRIMNGAPSTYSMYTRACVWLGAWAWAAIRPARRAPVAHAPCVLGTGRALHLPCRVPTLPCAYPAVHPPTAGESAKDKGKKGSGVGDKATGWLAALEVRQTIVRSKALEVRQTIVRSKALEA